jgi:hypothetical protein
MPADLPKLRLSMVPRRELVLAIVLGVLLTISTFAQPILSAKAGVVTRVEGKVLLDNQPIEPPITRFREMHENSVLRTEAGRAEVLLGPGYVLRLAESSALGMLDDGLTESRVRLQAGSAVVEVAEERSAAHTNIVVGTAEATLSKFGVYRFDAAPPRLAVFNGSALVRIGANRIPVPAGKMLYLDSGVNGRPGAPRPIASDVPFEPGPPRLLRAWDTRTGTADELDLHRGNGIFFRIDGVPKNIDPTRITAALGGHGLRILDIEAAHGRERAGGTSRHPPVLQVKADLPVPIPAGRAPLVVEVDGRIAGRVWISVR